MGAETDITRDVDHLHHTATRYDQATLLSDEHAPYKHDSCKTGLNNPTAEQPRTRVVDQHHGQRRPQLPCTQQVEAVDVVQERQVAKQQAGGARKALGEACEKVQWAGVVVVRGEG